MSDGFDESKFWLPSQFLSDDDWLIEREYMKTVSTNGNDHKGFTKDVFGGPYDFHADLSSPVESASTETESDEDDYGFLSGLTHQMARSSLRADDRSSKCWPSKPVSRSPQSTLCQIGTGCGCKPAASRGSSKGFSNSKVCSASPQATWDLLYAAAGEVYKMKLNEEEAASYYGSHLGSGGPLLGPTRDHLVPNRSTTHSSSDVALYHKLQALRLEQLRQQQLLKRQQQQQQQRVAWGAQGGSHLHHNHPSYQGGVLPGLASVSQALQQQKHSRSGMQAVFLGSQPVKKERNGTGVFLPRRAGTPGADTRKKSEGSILFPARVAQVDNRYLNDVSGSQPARPCLPAYNDYGDLRHLRGDFLGGSHGDQSFRTHSPVTSREIRLPQEWTY